MVIVHPGSPVHPAQPWLPLVPRGKAEQKAMSISQQKGCQVSRVKRCEPKGPASPGAVPKASRMPRGHPARSGREHQGQLAWQWDHRHQPIMMSMARRWQALLRDCRAIGD